MADSRNNLSTDLADAVATVLDRFILPAQTLTVALSGGVDSVVLLDVLRRLQPRFAFRLMALHVDHQISPKSGRWAAFCGHLCTDWNIPLRIESVCVPRDTGHGLEAAARAARYRVLARTDTDWVVAAHQQDDQVETVLFNLLRGSGPRGVAAMAAVRELATLPRTARPLLLRPMLAITRDRIETYARWRGLEWIVDDSNCDTRLTRNFLRGRILPHLARHFPGYRTTVTRSAEWSREAAYLLDVLAEIDHAQAADSDGRLDVHAVAQMEAPRARNLLRYWLRRNGVGMPNSALLGEGLRQLTTAGPDARVVINIGGRAIRRYRGWAALTDSVVPTNLEDRAWNGEDILAWGEGRIVFRKVRGAGIDATRLRHGAIRVTRRRGGERLRIDPSRPRRTLKNLLQESGVPAWERQSLPLLWCDDDLVWVPGVGIAAEYRCEPQVEGWLPRWEKQRPSDCP
jgi:tRNA(Ile)-lysidine synthase